MQVCSCVAQSNFYYAHDHFTKSDAFARCSCIDILLRSTCADHYLISSFAAGRVYSPHFLVLSIIYLLPLCMFLLCTTCLCALSFLFLCFFVDAFLSYMVFLDIVFRFPFEA